MDAIPHILILSLLPAFALVVGMSISLFKRPSAQFFSVVQHFAAGIVLAAAVIEVLPIVVDAHERLTTYLGFGLGVLLLMAIKMMTPVDSGYAHLQLEQKKNQLSISNIKSVSFITALALDLLINGLLLGIAFIVSERGGILVAIGVSFEVFFLGLMLVVLLYPRFTHAKIFVLSLGLFLVVLMGACLGAYFSSVLTGALFIGWLAFGVAALLYSVVEKVLAEAHAKVGTRLDTAVFFLGFFIVLILEEWH